jgi:cyclohexadieny/prephenate dehydrogenase
MSETQLFNRITIIGLGLIGSSIARVVRELDLSASIVGCDANEVSLAFARKEGFVDIIAADPAKAVEHSELVIIATPPATLGEIAEKIGPHLAHGCVVMDTASVKIPAIMAIAPHIPAHTIYVPAHPIAGSEHQGVRAGRADLFHKRRIIITPEEPPQDELLTLVTTFWQRMGARVEGMPADIHDTLYGYMSHLPQLLAFGLKAPLGEFFERPELNPVYKIFLRISGSPAAMWAEIFALNHENLLRGIDRYLDVIHHVAGELENAPENEQSDEDAVLAHTVLFPRIVASCLVTTVMEAEKSSGFSFARYAGTGFADVTAPTLVAPEEDIERISAQYALVARLARTFQERLQALRNAVATGDKATIESAINA